MNKNDDIDDIINLDDDDSTEQSKDLSFIVTKKYKRRKSLEGDDSTSENASNSISVKKDPRGSNNANDDTFENIDSIDNQVYIEDERVDDILDNSENDIELSDDEDSQSIEQDNESLFELENLKDPIHDDMESNGSIASSSYRTPKNTPVKNTFSRRRSNNNNTGKKSSSRISSIKQEMTSIKPSPLKKSPYKRDQEKILKQEAKKWEQLDQVVLKEEVVSENESESSPFKKGSPLVRQKSLRLFDDFLESELGSGEIKKIKKDYLLTQLKYLSKEEGDQMMDNIKSEYVCSQFIS